MSSVVDQGRIGELAGQDSGIQPLSLTKTGALKTADRHGRYQEAVFRGNVYCLTTGTGGVALAAANASLVAATFQPLVGLLNPTNSLVAAVILQACYGTQATGAAAANEGIPVYQVAAPGASTTIAGTVPLSMKTLTAAGSKMIGSVNQAYTGNTVTWIVLKPFAGAEGPRMTAPTASINVNSLGSEELAGMILVPPGAAFGIGVLAAGTTITSAASLVWEEIPYP